MTGSFPLPMFGPHPDRGWNHRPSINHDRAWGPLEEKNVRRKTTETELGSKRDVRGSRTPIKTKQGIKDRIFIRIQNGRIFLFYWEFGW